MTRVSCIPIIFFVAMIAPRHRFSRSLVVRVRIDDFTAATVEALDLADPLSNATTDATKTMSDWFLIALLRVRKAPVICHTRKEFKSNRPIAIWNKFKCITF